MEKTALALRRCSSRPAAQGRNDGVRLSSGKHKQLRRRRQCWSRPASTGAHEVRIDSYLSSGKHKQAAEETAPMLEQASCTRASERASKRRQTSEPAGGRQLGDRHHTQQAPSVFSAATKRTKSVSSPLLRAALGSSACPAANGACSNSFATVQTKHSYHCGRQLRNHWQVNSHLIVWPHALRAQVVADL